MLKGLEVNLVVPDLWQQEAVRALQAGQDVVVQAPTGAGKTYIFELLYPSLKGQAVFTVPTRALANDKLAEWRGRGWDVGIATGDLALNTGARVVVATLETQRTRFLRREGPALLVVDEYQMIADPVRGVHYELALALAPPRTQLLLLSGSVGNPQDVVAWLRRLGREVHLVSHSERPVPLVEVDLGSLPESNFVQGRHFWARTVGRALRADLAPVLLFAPRRRASEEMAQAIGTALSVRDPLTLSPEQEQVAGKKLARLLRNRVAYHHSGLSYAARAGLIEPLAKAGQLDVVVATMGLAAGINFSMRSVLITDTRYFAGAFQKQVQADELLQMFGRAGRRGLDDTGHVLFLPDLPRLGDARPRSLKRANPVDWPSLLSVMNEAAARGEEPFRAAVDLSASLFSPQRIALGVEHPLATGPRPCGLMVEAERARFIRRGMTEMLGSANEWEPETPVTTARLGEALVQEEGEWRRALTLPRLLDGRGFGNLCRLRAEAIYGREIPLATRTGDNLFTPVKWLRRALKPPGADPRGSAAAAEPTVFSPDTLAELVTPRLPEWTGGGELAELVTRGDTISARVDFSGIMVEARLDQHGRPLLDPPVRAALPMVCRACDQRDHDLRVPIEATPTYAWRTLGLVEAEGTPTRRGVIFSFFQAGEGLAVAAALEEKTYPVEDLVFDLANIRAGPRFAGEDAPLGGRLGALCQRVYSRADHPGYLEMGVPVQYGSGAAEVVREIVASPGGRYRISSETLRSGDIERALMEWRSLLRHIVSAPEHDWDRWRELKEAAARFVDRTVSPASLELPRLLAAQKQRRGTFAA